MSFCTLHWDRGVLWFLSSQRNNTLMITFLTQKLKTERMTTACYLQRSSMTIIHNVGHFGATRQRRLFRSYDNDLGQVSYHCTCL